MDKRIIFGVVLVLVIAFLGLLVSPAISGFFGFSQRSLPALKIGVIGVLSGPVASSWGFDAKNGLDLAVEDLNKVSGLAVELIIGDSSAKPEIGLSEFKRIASLDSPDVFIVEASAVASAIAPVAKDYNKPIVFTAAAAEKITSASDLLFRNFYLCEEEAPFMAKKAFNDLNIRSVAVLYQKEPFGESCSRLFTQTFASLGGKVVLVDSFLLTDTDFRTQLLKTKELEFDSIYMVGYENQMLGIVKQMNEIGLKKTILSGRLIFAPASRNEIIKYTKNVKVYFGGTDFYLNSPSALSFRQRYAEKYAKEPSHVAAYAYDSVLLIAKAYEISKQKNISLKDALLQVRVSGVNGGLSFNTNRETNQPAYLLTINSEGKAEIVK